MSPSLQAEARLTGESQEYRRFTDQDEKPKDWNFVKVHLRLHGIPDIRAKGTLVSTTTKISEKFHGPMRKHYLRQTNFKNVVVQVSVPTTLLVLRRFTNIS